MRLSAQSIKILLNRFYGFKDFIQEMMRYGETANLYARIEPDVKEQAESILAALGIPASNAINMFYKTDHSSEGTAF